MFASTVRALSVLLMLTAAGCACPSGQSCQPTGGTGGAAAVDPGEPGGIRTNVVAIERNGTVIGYMSQDPDPTKAHWNWWLLGDTASLPLDLGPSDVLRFVPLGQLNPPEPPRGLMNGAQLCAEFGARLTAPKYYKEVSQVGAATNCQ